jgi:phosphoribosyl 1,2-cyclic phosphodiesterase/DNA-binding response OmpR family regulator
MQVQFWGTRGSIAKAGPGTVRYGGNTACVEVRSAAGTLVVLDCGTGAHGLGHALAEARSGPRRGHILITHTHWDHIQGFPFFAPLRQAGDTWDVYAPRGLRESLRDTLAGQMEYTYFPISLEAFAATVHYHDLVEGAFTIGDIRVSTQYLNHTALTLGYRLEADGVTVVYATDHEPHSPTLAAGDAAGLAGEDRRHVEFLGGADLVIHDAQYTAAEYPAKAGWGHSTVESVVAVARLAGARRLALFHHDPLRDDDAMDHLVTAARRQADGSLDVFAGTEGTTIDVGRAAARDHERSSPLAARTVVPAEMLAQTVMIGVGDAGLRERLAEAVRADDLTLVTAGDADEVLRQARSSPPSVLLLGRWLGGVDGLEVCRALRQAVEGEAKRLPVILVAPGEAEADRGPGAVAGVTDWLVAPFSTLYARTRIRAWALRQACRWMCATRPSDEAARLSALHQLGILDSAPEERFDRITRLARRLFDTPIALVSLVDAERQWFKSRAGVELEETPREYSFCAHAIHDDRVFVVPDALLDPRFADNPMVTGASRIRFYAGRPVRFDGRRVGTLCLADSRPRQLRDDDVQALEDLAVLVEKELATSPAATTAARGPVRGRGAGAAPARSSLPRARRSRRRS